MNITRNARLKDILAEPVDANFDKYNANNNEF
jgi:hypothetical protein